jgi:hypothetical protein
MRKPLFAVLAAVSLGALLLFATRAQADLTILTA